ncbi:MAG: hypothetical protein LBT98_03280, partial [Puniceicoccales bacterium]|jgi:hypothetical protein|nr:hypothetical protein [Puniceicoccales bacterium]
LKSETQNISVEKIVIPPCKLQTCKTTGICPVLFTTCLIISLLALAGAVVMVIFLPFPWVFLAVPLAALAIGSIGLFILYTCLRNTKNSYKIPPSVLAEIHASLSEIESPTNENVKTLLQLLFGENFPVDGSKLGKIDFNNISDDGLPAALAQYSRKRHGVKILAAQSPFGILTFATHSKRSVYRQKNVFVPQAQWNRLWMRDTNVWNRENCASVNKETIWGDISQITATSYVCPSPACLLAKRQDMPSKRAFCEALHEEFDGKNLIIVDMSSGNENYLFDWENDRIDSEFEPFFPANGMVTNVQKRTTTVEQETVMLEKNGEINSINASLAFTLQSFQLKIRNGKMNTFYQLRIKNWPDGGAPIGESAQAIIDSYKWFEARVAELSGRPQEPVYLLAHCDSGAGRSPSFLIYRDIDRVASACEKLGWACTYDDSKQNQMLVESKVNLSWVLCRILQNGINARSVYGCGRNQFLSYADYAEYRAGQSEGQNTTP